MNCSTSVFMLVGLLAAAACGSESASRAPGEPAATAPSLSHATSHSEAAIASLGTLHDLVQSGDPRKRGFQSAEEVWTAELSEPLRMYMVDLASLRSYRPGDDPRALYIDEQSVFYPVVVRGEVRSSMTVRKQNGAWSTTAFGQSTLARAAVLGRSGLQARRGSSAGEAVLVEIPALSTQFLAHEENGISFLTPVNDIQGTDLHAGQTLPASDMLERLAPLAARGGT